MSIVDVDVGSRVLLASFPNLSYFFPELPFSSWECEEEDSLSSTGEVAFSNDKNHSN